VLLAAACRLVFAASVDCADLVSLTVRIGKALDTAQTTRVTDPLITSASGVVELAFPALSRDTEAVLPTVAVVEALDTRPVGGVASPERIVRTVTVVRALRLALGSDRVADRGSACTILIRDTGYALERGAGAERCSALASLVCGASGLVVDAGHTFEQGEITDWLTASTVVAF
jgi:hypothetical protein